MGKNTVISMASKERCSPKLINIKSKPYILTKEKTVLLPKKITEENVTQVNRGIKYIICATT